MKNILQLSALLICMNGYSQNKPTNRPYFKLSPSLVFIKDLDPAPSIIGGFGGHLGRYAAFGIGTGYLKFEGASNPVIPLGLDLTLTDFGVKKVEPVITIQAYYPIYSESTNITSRSGTSSIYVTSEAHGQFMFNIGGGLAAPITKKKKLFLTGSYGQLMMKSSITTQSIVSSRSSTSKSTNNSQTEMVTVSLTFMF